MKKHDELSLQSASQIKARLIEKASKTLYPPFSSVFRKLFALHLVSSVLTLSVCPQFGFRIFGEGHGLMHYFMFAGTYGCQVLCGAFYMLSTVGLSLWALNIYEKRCFLRNGLLSVSSLSLMSLTAFNLISQEASLLINLAWLSGAIGLSFPVLVVTQKVSQLESKT